MDEILICDFEINLMEKRKTWKFKRAYIYSYFVCMKMYFELWTKVKICSQNKTCICITSETVLLDFIIYYSSYKLKLIIKG